MTYQETLDYLFSQLPMFQRLGKAAYKADLVNTLALDEHFNHSHRQFKSIHVAGTNGKGSTSHMLAAVLSQAGYRVGLYTSPHLKDFRERIKINGQPIPEEEVVLFVENNKAIFKQIRPSFFEMTVALAFDYFAREKVDVAVVEVGLGGRLDSTNIITPELSVITNIGLDHTDLLGDTLEKIAFEKAGIIKPNVPAVLGESNPAYLHVFTTKAKEVGTSLILADRMLTVEDHGFSSNGRQWFRINGPLLVARDQVEIDLGGAYQEHNILTVLAAIQILVDRFPRVSPAAVLQGLSSAAQNTGLKGRWQILGINPLVVCDTGHNVDGIGYVVKQLELTPHRKLHFVLGMVSDKDVRGVLGLLPKSATYYFTKASIPRAMSETTLKELASGFDLIGACYPNVLEAFNAAKINAEPNDLVFIGGSTFVVAEVV
ncbi:MAG TPA: folylpolyglutamate synthase/dihydrofolate synthase family protein [Williamwhitmania sp.]|nr:folylpolyglutamate synthase/dihydrofolate synthase family protein [Williamwhitmania sp.]